MKTLQHTKKIVGRILTGVLILIVIVLALIAILPGYDIYMVRSDSMKPIFSSGDVIITGPVEGLLSGDLVPGKVITFDKDKKTRITHRLIEINGDTLQTKGDALEDPDPFTVKMSQVTGIYLFKIPYVGYLTSTIRTKMGWYLLIIVPAMALVSLIIKDILKEAFKKT